MSYIKSEFSKSLWLLNNCFTLLIIIIIIFQDESMLVKYPYTTELPTAPLIHVNWLSGEVSLDQ